MIAPCQDPVAITGLGSITAAGRGLAAQSRALAAGSSLLRVQPDPDLPLSNDYPIAAVHAGLPTAPQRSAALGLAAVSDALVQAGLQAADRRPAGLVIGTCTGGMRESDHYFLTQGADAVGSCYTQQQTHRVGEFIARRSHCQGPQSSHSVACASAGCAIAEAGDWIRQGICEQVVVCGTDALCRVTMAGFASLQVMDQAGSRPLTEERAGMNLGEGAAALVLESAASAAARGATVLAWLRGWGQRSDAYHATAPEPSGTALRRAIEAALQSAGLPATAIDYANLHGTGTQDNDAVEAKVIDELFGQLPVASSKAYSGHTMGAAAAVEAVVACLALQEQRQWASTGAQGLTPLPGIELVRETRDRPLDLVLSTSLAFGGNNVALIFGRAA